MDEYERKHLQGQGRVLYRDKVKIHPVAARMIGLAGLGALVASAVGLAVGDAQMAVMLAISGLPLLGVVLVFNAVRIQVTERELHLQVGLGGPRVLIADIESCLQLGPDDPRAKRAKEYPLKDGGHALELHLDNGDVVRIRTHEARVAALAAAVEEARAAAGAKVRVELGDSAHHEIVLEEPAAENHRA